MSQSKQVQIRNMDPEVWRDLRREALDRGTPLHLLVTGILTEWLGTHAGKARTAQP